MPSISWEGTALVALVIAFIVWLVRLEGRVNSTKDVADMAAVAAKSLQHSHGVLEVKISEELGRISSSVARIEGFIHGRTDNGKQL